MATVAHPSMAQNDASSGQAAPQPVLSTNDPRNPYHLTASQQTELRAMNSAAQQQAMSIRDDSTLTNQQKAVKLMHLKASLVTQIKSVLTPAQTEETHKVAQVLEASGAKIKALNLQLEASLTATQKQEAASIKNSAMQQANSIQQSNETIPQKQQQLQQLSASYNQQLTSLLTPSQKAILAQMKAIQQAAPIAARKAIASE